MRFHGEVIAISATHGGRSSFRRLAAVTFAAGSATLVHIGTLITLHSQALATCWGSIGVHPAVRRTSHASLLGRPAEAPARVACEDKHAARRRRAQVEAPLLRPRLRRLRELHRSGTISVPDACVAYLVAYLQVRYGPAAWLAGRRQTLPPVTPAHHVAVGPRHSSMNMADPHLRGVIDPLNNRQLSQLRLGKEASFQDLLGAARLRRVPEYVPRCLFNFYAGLRPLELLWRVPSSEQILELQASGRRCISALASEKALQIIFGHRDCLEMLMHDCAHAEKFVEHGMYWQQVGFFEFLRSTVASMHERTWSATWGHRWRLSWRYISSDMNAVATHLFHTLRAPLMCAVARNTLRQAQCLDAATEAEDAALAGIQMDSCPRSELDDWAPGLEAAGLHQTFEEAYAKEWRGLLLQHVKDVSDRFPGIFTERPDLALSEPQLPPDFAEWPRPSVAAFLAAAAGRGHRGAVALAAGEEERPKAVRQREAAALIAHFDELGRRHLANRAQRALQSGSTVVPLAVGAS